jgi:hypothetical protein
MWYLLKIDVLISALVFGVAGLLIFAMFAWEMARNLAHAALRARKPATYTKLETSFPRAA